MIDGNTALAEIRKYLEDVQADIIKLALAHKPFAMNASGKTLGSLEVVMTSTGGKLLANTNIIYLETGRGPTSPTGPYQLDPEGKTLLDHVKQWIDDKGLDLNPYAVTKTIHAKGTKLFRNGGNSGILSIPLNGAGLNTLYYNIATHFSQEVSSEIFEPVNEFQNS